MDNNIFKNLLNVFFKLSTNKKLPVMAFIHGGGFMMGASSYDMYGPYYLLNRDIIYVAFNYRLGVLGFASSGDGVIKENLGLKDQALALKWIQENIAAYGGDSGSVTIFGESAGGASVHYQTLSPLSEGLFHRAIAMSGSATCLWGTGDSSEVERPTKKLALRLGCPVDSSQEMLECLQKLPASELIQNTANLTDLSVAESLILFHPVIENDKSKEAFLSTNPFETKSSVPFISGMTSEEGLLFLVMFGVGIKESISNLNENLQKLTPFYLYTDKAENPIEVTKEIKEFYFGDKLLNMEDLPEVINLFTDLYFFQGMMSAVRNHIGTQYLYYFSQESENSLYKFFSRSNDSYGVSHGDDLLFLFPVNFPGITNGPVQLNEEDKQFSEKFISLWTNFAIYGNPTPEGEDIEWKPTKPGSTDYMHLELGKFGMKKNLLQERDIFWQNLKYKNAMGRKTQKEEL